MKERGRVAVRTTTLTVMVVGLEKNETIGEVNKFRFEGWGLYGLYQATHKAKIKQYKNRCKCNEIK